MTDRESGKEGAGEWRLLETGEQQSRLAIICGKPPPPTHTNIAYKVAGVEDGQVDARGVANRQRAARGQNRHNVDRGVVIHLGK